MTPIEYMLAEEAKTKNCSYKLKKITILKGVGKSVLRAVGKVVKPIVSVQLLGPYAVMSAASKAEEHGVIKSH